MKHKAGYAYYNYNPENCIKLHHYHNHCLAITPGCHTVGPARNPLTSQPIMCKVGIRCDFCSQSESAVIILPGRVHVTRIITLVGRNLKTFLFKIYNLFSINIYTANVSVLFYLYKNLNIRGINLYNI